MRHIVNAAVPRVAPNSTNRYSEIQSEGDGAIRAYDTSSTRG
jgi:hypothetical protein